MECYRKRPSRVVDQMRWWGGDGVGPRRRGGRKRACLRGAGPPAPAQEGRCLEYLLRQRRRDEGEFLCLESLRPVCTTTITIMFVRRPKVKSVQVALHLLFQFISGTYCNFFATEIERAPDGHTSAENGEEGKRDYYYLSFLLEETITNDSLALLC